MTAPDGFILQHKDEFVCISVSPEDYERVEAAGPWHVADRGHWRYVTRHVGQTKQYLHRYVLDVSRSLQVDHIDGNGFNNRRENLRPATNAEQGQNMLRRGGSSRFRGVTWNAAAGKWQAQVMKSGRHFHLGLFRSEDAAGRAAAKGRARMFTHAVESRHPVSDMEEA